MLVNYEKSLKLFKEKNMNEGTIEAMIKFKKLSGERITPEIIDQSIASAQYHVFPGTTTTVCLLTLTNGYTVLGESACASPENFDEELGRHIAYENARNKIWSLEGYLLKQRLYEGSVPSA